MPESTPHWELEYNALRAEILKRIDLRHQMLSIALTVAGVFLGIGVTNGTIALIYPPLAVFLMAAWAQNDRRIYILATDLRHNAEPALGLAYEMRMNTSREGERDRGWRQTILSHGGVFLFTQLIALGVGLLSVLPTRAFSLLTIGLLVLDGIAVIVVFFVLRGARR